MFYTAPLPCGGASVPRRCAVPLPCRAAAAAAVPLPPLPPCRCRCAAAAVPLRCAAVLLCAVRSTL